jgi:hypothetical protein
MNLYIKARKTYEVYLCRLTDVGRRNHPKTISVLNTMADYYNKFGTFVRGTSTRGLICRVEVVERSKIAFGKSDPRTVRYMELLARDYYNGLSYAKARQVQEQVVKERGQTYGQSHEETVESREFLGHIRSVGKFHRTISWAIPRVLRNMECRYDGPATQFFRKSKIIAGV